MTHGSVEGRQDSQVWSALTRGRRRGTRNRYHVTGTHSVVMNNMIRFIMCDFPSERYARFAKINGFVSVIFIYICFIVVAIFLYDKSFYGDVINVSCKNIDKNCVKVYVSFISLIIFLSWIPISILLNRELFVWIFLVYFIIVGYIEIINTKELIYIIISIIIISTISINIFMSIMAIRWIKRKNKIIRDVIDGGRDV